MRVDVVLKLTNRVGTQAHNAKLNDSKVRLIRALYRSGAKMTELADRFQVAETTISKVIRNQRWAHVSDPDGVITTRPGSARGSEHYRAKVDEKEVLKIRDLYRNGWTRRRIGQQFGLSLGAVAGILKGRNWKHVVDPNGPVPKHHPGLPGSRHPNAKLTESQVREIFLLDMKGMTACAIAARYGVSDATIRLILKGKSWTHVPVPSWKENQCEQ